MRALLVIAIGVLVAAGLFLRSEFLVCLATGHGCSAPDARASRPSQDPSTAPASRELQAPELRAEREPAPESSAAPTQTGPVRYILPGGQIGYASDASEVPEGAAVIDAAPRVQVTQDTQPRSQRDVRQELERLRWQNLRAAEEEASWRQSANYSADQDQARLDGERERQRIREERESRRRGWSYSRTTTSSSTTGSKAWK